MYDVLFTPEKVSCQARIFTSDDIVVAVSYALQLHTSSNVAHEVIVFNNDSDDYVLSLVKK